MIAFLAAAVCGGLASVIRYLVGVAFAGRGRLPWAVFIVNSVGSGLGGVVVGLTATSSISADLRLVVLGGVAGGLTTFSTWTTETVQLAMNGKWNTALVNVVLGLAVGLAAAVGGYLIATGLL